MVKKRKPGRPKSKPADVRSEIIPLRLTGAERRTAEDAARRAGKTLSEWMRARLLGADPSEDLASRVLAAVSATPMPLGELYRAVTADGASVTLGQFHDALRDLASTGGIALSPWTQAMYQLRDAECCFVIGAEIVGYAENRPDRLDVE